MGVHQSEQTGPGLRIVVTGGAGFIGSALVRHLLANTAHTVLNIDKLTYAGNIDALGDAVRDASAHPRYRFAQLDIGDGRQVEGLLHEFAPHRLINLAAETHVDRSIDGPADFIQTNVVGTLGLLEAVRAWLPEAPDGFLFHHVSTDEVYGDLTPDAPAFTERSPYAPSSPYSASKAASDHLVRAWHRTYGVPALVTNTSNNYGPYHHPEKLIPHMIICAMRGQPLPVYGDGAQVRDWLFVEDHARALTRVLEAGRPGMTINIGGDTQVTNLTVVQSICSALEAAGVQRPSHVGHFADLITHVPDRPGHDRRYAIDNSGIQAEFGWQPAETFETGLQKTVEWYLNNESWWSGLLGSGYQLKRIGRG